MAVNTLTNLIPTIYEAMDIVSREMIGFIPAAMLDASAQRAAKDQTIRSFIAPASTAADITPATTAPDTGAQTIGSLTLTISKSRAVPFQWTGEEELSVGGSGPGVSNIRRDQIAQALRTLANEIEIDLGNAIYQNASRASGTAGTTPFASDLSDPANILKILKDNGSPTSDLQLVVDTAAGANLRSLSQLTRANEAASPDTLRRGVLLDVHGFAIRESAGVELHTKGTGTSYVLNGAAVIGQTVIPIDTGSGTVVVGDVVTFAADANNKYIVTVGVTAPGSITIGKPGLIVAIADTNAMTIGANHTPNVAFHRSSLVLLARQPALPPDGDAATDRLTVMDPASGISFDFALYAQYHRVHYEVGLSWGTAGIKDEHTAVMLG